MIYLTFNEAPSGIFSSQVIDVVKFLNKECSADVKLWCFISLRNYSGNRKKIRSQIGFAKVFPMLPTMRLWKMNRFLLYFLLFFSSEKKIMGRSAWATWLALKAKKRGLCKKVVYDGRGAIYHECSEYKVIESEKQAQGLREIEKMVVLQSDFRLAVSHKLAEHWKNFFGYTGGNHVVIPCTLNSVFFHPDFQVGRSAYRSEESNKIIGVYSGSVAGWQSISYLSAFFEKLFGANPSFQLLVLSAHSAEWQNLQSKFPGRIEVTFVEPARVPSLLVQADYGFLIREDSVTNRVASPVKFAEYLSCGLKVLISPFIGDFSEFVRANNCGFVLDQGSPFVLEKVDAAEKERISKLAENYFRKEKFMKEYEKILSV
jgi:glycosyltransferase involved in cell wall biosynthesis